MGRLLILVLLVVLVAWWVFGRAGRLRNSDASRSKAPPEQDSPIAVQDMVACAHCGLHLPRGDALTEGSSTYCGEPHRLLGPRE